ncbi:replicative DNA helicase [Oleiharenicola lentus]|jgi:replicative DNA helicase|uniref:Replicative DNA helicase n=1 Tax=Oleiharenicola lentus TaxID=2508720 RepID=A0A4Q1C9D1_9BACT|nr:replicative DNA helicase [Oleiharenicola lentus]RXK55452.1 replicative DNA helicase [Oleiharenicola lentus]
MADSSNDPRSGKVLRYPSSAERAQTLPSAAPDRSPPHSAEAEEHVIACCLLDGSDTIARCLESRVTAEAFYLPQNRLLFEVMLELYQKSPPVSLEILAEELKTRRQLEAVGGFPYLMQVTGKIPTTAHAGYFIEKVREKHLLRELIKTATGAVEQAYSFTGGLEEFVDKIEQDLFKVTQDRVSDNAQEIKEAIKDANTVIAKLLMKKGELTGVSSGFKDLDAMTFGFQRQEMIIIAARPSMGKTSFALNIAEAAAMPKKGDPVAVLVFSLEMSSSQLALRMLCARSRVNMKLLRDGLVSRDGAEVNALGRTAEEFKRAPILIDDASNLTIMELRAKARRIHARKKLGMVIVDYLQLLSGTDPRAPREQQVAEVSRGLKALAKELDVPVLVLSQLNRSSEKENRTPRLSDLRESGSIEQDADVVLMLSRPKDADEKFQTAAGAADLIVAKQRNGPVGDLKLTFLQEITRFENFTP